MAAAPALRKLLQQQFKACLKVQKSINAAAWSVEGVGIAAGTVETDDDGGCTLAAARQRL